MVKSILDTDVFSEYLKGHNAAVAAHAERYADGTTEASCVRFIRRLPHLFCYADPGLLASSLDRPRGADRTSFLCWPRFLPSYRAGFRPPRRSLRFRASEWSPP